MRGKAPPDRQRLRTAAGRSVSQQAWLARQVNDPYVAAARQQGFRSRAAFKLLELDERFHIVRPGARVVDLGAAPGGWTQAVLRLGAGHVVALDLLVVEPISGALLLQGDFREPEIPERLRLLLGGPPDLVLSDMAPNTMGHAATDNLRVLALVELAFHFAESVLAPGGTFVAKVFQGGAERAVLDGMKRRFATVRHAKPKASRKESRELYVVAQDFRP